jgi:hypothetical protein
MQPISTEFAEKKLRTPSVYQVGTTVKIVDVKEASYNGYPYRAFETTASSDEGLSFSSLTKVREGRYLTEKSDPTTGKVIEVADSLPSRAYPKGTFVDALKALTAKVMALDESERTYGKLAELAREEFKGKSFTISSQARYLDKGGEKHDLKDYNFVAE